MIDLDPKPDPRKPKGGGLEGWAGGAAGAAGVNTWMLFLSGQSLSVHTTMHVPAAV